MRAADLRGQDKESKAEELGEGQEEGPRAQ